MPRSARTTLLGSVGRRPRHAAPPERHPRAGHPPVQGFQLGFPLHVSRRFDAARGDGGTVRASSRVTPSTAAIRAARSCRAVIRRFISPRSPYRTQPAIGRRSAVAHGPTKNAAVEAALDWGMAQTQHNTRAIVVVHGDEIVGERYAPGWTTDTPQISWSAGKSITAALVGILVRRGELNVDDVAPVKAWRASRAIPRGQIRDPRSAAHEQRPGLRQPGPERPRVVHCARTSTCASTSTASTCSSMPSTSRSEIPPNTAVALPQQRSADARPHRAGQRRSARRAVPDVPAAGALRQDRRPQLRARNRRVGQLHHDRLRLRVGARLGAVRTAPPARRRLARASASCRRAG
mgnify:CR=1 FL=1